MGKYRNIFFSEAIAHIEPKLCINHWKVLCKLCVFYVDRNSKMITTAGHSICTGPIGSFYNHITRTWGERYSLEGLWCNLQSQARTHAVLMIGFYELLGNPSTQLIEPPCLLIWSEEQLCKGQITRGVYMLVLNFINGHLHYIIYVIIF